MSEIIQIIEKKEIYDILDECKTFFTSYSSDEISLKNLADKYYKHAIVYKIVEDYNNLGFVSFYYNDLIERVAFLSMIILKKTSQNKGYGKLLMKVFEDYSKQNGMKVLRLEVNKKNEKAQGFYEKLGYVIESQTEKTYFMRKEIDL